MPRCIGCDRYTDAPYFCVGCSFDSDYYGARTRADQFRAPTATSLSRQQQRRVNDAVAYEQFIACQDLTDQKTAAMRLAASDRGMLTMQDLRGKGGQSLIKDAFGYLVPHDPVARKAQRTRRVMTQFARMWSAIAWQLLDDLTRPDSP